MTKIMEHIILQGITVETLSEIIRKTVHEEVNKRHSQTSIGIIGANENYLTRSETAARLRISLATLTEWVKKSRINAYKIGGRVLFRESEVETALSQIVPLKYYER